MEVERNKGERTMNFFRKTLKRLRGMGHRGLMMPNQFNTFDWITHIENEMQKTNSSELRQALAFVKGIK
jgi:hypothetical protein